jgi:23S rRNA (adenine2503-C2)-methyltransferase
MEAVKIINDKEKINIGSRRISISTSGIPEGIEKLAGEKLQLNIAVSLNASDNDTRSKLMPVNLKYPLEKLFPAIRYYIKKTSRRVMIEYVLMKGINDRPGDSEKLSALLKRELGMGGLYFVNLIPFNGDEVFLSPAPAEIKRFKYYLEKHGIKTTQRYRFGKNISGACGQLVYQSDGTCPNDY